MLKVSENPDDPADKQNRRKSGVKQRTERLRDRIRHLEYLYYVLDAPEFSNAAFDRLMQQLKPQCC